MVTGITKAKRKAAFGVDGAPTVLTAPTAVTSIESALNTTSDSAQVTFKATDPGGFPITYDIDYLSDSDKVAYTNDSSNLPPHLAHPAQISLSSADANGDKTATYRFLTRAATGLDSHGGVGIAQTLNTRYLASDGIKTTASSSTLVITFGQAITFDPSLTGITDRSGEGNGTNSDQYHVQVSNSTHTAMSGLLMTGKRYFEVRIDSITSYLMIGFVDAGAGASAANYSANTSSFLYQSGLTRYPGGSGTSISGSMGVGTILGFAYDTSNGQTWFSLNNDFGNKVPGTDAGWEIGSYSGNGNAGMKFAFTGGSSGIDHKGTILRGNNLTYSPPSGFLKH
jgi:hypothetical protein